jgi:hypothetical protein
MRKGSHLKLKSALRSELQGGVIAAAFAPPSAKKTRIGAHFIMFNDVKTKD